jgi:hypothetical protein
MQFDSATNLDRKSGVRGKNKKGAKPQRLLLPEENGKAYWTGQKQRSNQFVIPPAPACRGTEA